MKAVGPLHRAMAPGNFTYSSHMAMFMGFTPGDALSRQTGVNPKFGKIFRMSHGGIAGKGKEHFLLDGRNIVDGFSRRGYQTLGTGAVGWFNPQTDTAANLIGDFQNFFYPGNTWSLRQQLAWLRDMLPGNHETPVFTFLNIGETHVPYYFEGAPWSSDDNPCVPFSDDNDAREARRRQVQALEWVDGELSGLLNAFADSTVVVCADHGDCWGEDGLWEHGISHDKVLEVPLLFRLGAS
ncbi:sulfatase-like hydrolase/transferase [Thiolapillus brandeum]|nr:sulfatase-like hydrolase/transferase [Thiolapillus brandeum]